MLNRIKVLLVIIIVVAAAFVIAYIATWSYPLHFWLSNYLNENDITKMSIIISPFADLRPHIVERRIVASTYCKTATN